MQQRGCTEGAGQDYARLDAPNGIVELHLAYNTSGTILPLGQTISLEVNNGPIGASEFSFSNLNISRINLGVTFDDYVSSVGANAIVFHTPHGTVTGWNVNTKLNCGVTRI